MGKFDHPMSEHGRRKIRLWQATCSLVVFVPSEETEEVIFKVFDMLVVSITETMFHSSCSAIALQEHLVS